jgi:hypothetical protein
VSRHLIDEELRTWEVYATAGSFGRAERARIVFHCLTDEGLRALWTEREGDRQEAEAWLEEASGEDLAESMAAAEELR